MERRLAAILAADVVGYSRLMNRDEAGTLAVLKSHRAALIDPKIAEHNGRIVKLMGDGALVEFASVVDAVTCAVEIQQAMAGRNAGIPEDQRMAFRIGINLGDIIVEGEDIYGDGVNIAARLEGLAEPGGVCISEDAFKQVRNKLALGFRDLGEQSVKNIPQPVRAYGVLLEPGEAGRVIAARPWRSWRHAARIAGLLLLLAAAGVVGWLRPWAPPPDRPTIAVLPFENMSGDPEQEYFADGLSEDLITDLSKISGLFVIARNSSFAYKGKTMSVKQVASELGVRYVLEGSVRRDGGRVRINAQLIDATTEGHIWADRYDRDYENIFALQDEVIGKIAQALKVNLTAGERRNLAGGYTSSAEAYELFLRGRDLFTRRTRDDNLMARELLRKAVAVDPEFARAYALLARTYRRDVVGARGDSPEASLDRAEALARKALAIDDSSPHTRFAMAALHRTRGDYVQAIAEIEKALALDPNFADAYAILGQFLHRSGQPREGELSG